VGALIAPKSMALMCRWRSRPQHQERTLVVRFCRAPNKRLKKPPRLWGGTRPSVGSMEGEILEGRRLEVGAPLMESGGLKLTHTRCRARCRAWCVFAAVGSERSDWEVVSDPSRNPRLGRKLKRQSTGATRPPARIGLPCSGRSYLSLPNFRGLQSCRFS